jgi:hypothetical protein
MPVAGEAPEEELEGGATRPVVAARKGRDRDTKREEGEERGWEKRAPAGTGCVCFYFGQAHGPHIRPHSAGAEGPVGQRATKEA